MSLIFFREDECGKRGDVGKLFKYCTKFELRERTKVGTGKC